MNNNKNYAVDTSIFFSTNLFSKTVNYNIQTVNLPGINMNHPEAYGRGGTPFNVQADTLEFNELSMTIVIDEKLEIWKEIINHINKSINPNSGNIKNNEADSHISITNSFGHNILGISLFNSRIVSIGDLQYSSTSTNEILVLDVTVKYDYFSIDDTTELDVQDISSTVTTDISSSKTDLY